MISPCARTHGSLISSSSGTTRCAPAPAAVSRATQPGRRGAANRAASSAPDGRGREAVQAFDLGQLGRGRAEEEPRPVRPGIELLERLIPARILAAGHVPVLAGKFVEEGLCSVPAVAPARS